MNLKLQLISLIVSFIFGIFLFFMVKVNYKYLFLVSNKKKFIFSSIFCFDLSVLYFLILLYLNEGRLHLYFFLLIIFGFLMAYKFFKK